MKTAIIIMAKVPEPGKVKTRLQPFLTPEQSSDISTAFLRDAESKANSITENVYIAVSPFNEKHKLNNILQHNPILIEQTGECLGDRMLNAFKVVFEQGIESVVMFGTDSPTFPLEYIEQAFELLKNKNEIVLGKTEDGGFYLIGLLKLNWMIFNNVEWSSEKTFEQVNKNIIDLNLHLSELPIWYDVDKKEDFIRLQKELLSDKRAKRNGANTFDWLEKHFIGN